jgi:hypothetical protein
MPNRTSNMFAEAALVASIGDDHAKPGSNSLKPAPIPTTAHSAI